MKIYHALFSECGPRRKNEDYIAVREMPELGRSVFVLCDGMGGHNLGEVAGKLVAEHICDYWTKNPERLDSEKKIIDACDETMIAYNNKSRIEMGTTMAMAAIEGNKALLAHCGDSRIYLIRNQEIIYQSTDHVTLSPEGWPVISRAFFTGRNHYTPDIQEIEIKAGDMIFICSDGVYNCGKWNEIKAALLDENSFDSLDKIKKIAERNTNDNYSAILIHLQF
ncbi:MAG: serine/threonine-protein phosphatase [Muribaculaceae bacterium]|nr:serine/threonine-protein phosphatase [Muribaculaceae bacterium]